MELFTRSRANPILEPAADSWWQSRAVFNPAAVERDGVVYLLYRAVGHDENYVSRLGLATSADGVHFERMSHPWLTPSIPEDRWGTEDPRMTPLDEQIYITYTAVSQPVKESEDALRTDPLIATVNLISTRDFSFFAHHGLITPDYSDNKDTVLLPERIDNCFVMLHRPHRWSRQWCRNAGPDERAGIPEYVSSLPERPSIWLSYSHDLKSWFDHRLLMEPAEHERKLGAGPPPILTDRGWLLIYHAVTEDAAGERIYAAKAALLERDDPHRVIARTPEPVLFPRAGYETSGDVANVVFPSGLVRRGDTLYLYYGAADSTCALATASATELLDMLAQFPV